MTADLFAQQRANMVDSQIRTDDVRGAELLAALRSVPREDFVPEALRAVAYMGAPASLGHGRELLDPRSLSKLLAAAGPRAGESALVIGGSTGYSAALLAHMGLSVTLVESEPALAARARSLLGAPVKVVESPLPQGHAAGGPYELILIDGVIDSLPSGLVAQVTASGRIVGLVTDKSAAKAHIWMKSPSGSVSDRIVFDAAGKRLPGFAAEPGFVF